MSDTPRTDAIERAATDDTGLVTCMEPIWEGLEMLERENARLREALSEADDMLGRIESEDHGHRADEITVLRRELDLVTKQRDAWADKSRKSELESEIHRLKQICVTAHDRLLRGASDLAILEILDQSWTKEERIEKNREALEVLAPKLGFSSLEEMADRYAKTQKRNRK